MINSFYFKHKFAFKWIGIALFIKGLLFAFFTYSFFKYWPPEMRQGLFNASGDTSVYYGSVESFYNGNGYDTYCRMPGLLPIYYPIRLIFSVYWTQNIIILLQFFTGVVSVYALAQLAKLIFNNQRIFLFTFFIYAFSSFVSIWDHVGYADSFGVSFLIFSMYYLVKFSKENKHWKFLFISGFFMAWSLFFRPVHGIVIPFALLVNVLNLRDLIGSIKKGIIYGLPIVFFLGIWSYSNYSRHKKIVILQGDSSECFRGLTKEVLSMRALIIAWGGDIQPWAKDTEGEWFFSNISDKATEPSNDDIYTSQYNLDSLKQLRTAYVIAHNDTTALKIRKEYGEKMLEASQRYLQSYKSEHFFRYYVLNRIKLLWKFLVPKRLDDLPLPRLDQMNIIQKAVKAGYYLLLVFVNVFGFIGALIIIRKKVYFPLIPLSLLITLGPFMGFLEQRYLLPIYGFFVIFTAFALNAIYEFYLQRKSGRNKSS